MLKFMREHMNRWVLAVVVGVMAIVFVFFGVFPESRFGGGLRGDNVVASVGSEQITLPELEKAVNGELEAYGATGAMAENLKKTIRGQALNGLIQSKLFVLEARRVGISVSDGEAMDEIQKLPYFQDKDKKAFSVDLYKNILAANHMTPKQFETNVTNVLLQKKMASFLENRIRVTEDEVKREYMASNEKRNLQFVRITKDNAFKQMKVDAEELKKFLADPSKLSLIQANYAQNKQKYDRDEEVCARHILKRFEPAGKDGKLKPEDKAPASFLALNPNAANFADLAKKNSEDPGSKDNGGDLGCFPKGMMDKEFEATAFKLGSGQISGAIKSSFGWHYIFVYKKKPALKIALDNVKTEIAEELLKKDRLDEVRKINREQAETLAKNWGKKQDGFEVLDTGFFNALDGFIPKIGHADDILHAVFDTGATIQKGPQVFEAQGTFIVATIKEKQTADASKFAEQRDQQERSIRARKMQAFMPGWMQYVQKNHTIKINEKLLSAL